MQTYLAKAFPTLEKELASEVLRSGGEVLQQWGELFLFRSPSALFLWSQFLAKDPQVHHFQSINDGAQILLQQKKRWCSISSSHHRRAELIQEKVFKYKIPQFGFLRPPERHEWGFWSLIEQNKMILAPVINSPWPLGEIQLATDLQPPSRAYLKLWEAFTCHVQPPQSQERVLELGASPGGWTWVLAQLGCQVTAVDKAPLDPKLSAKPNVTFIKKDAFKLTQQEVQSPLWLMSDLICYPKDLYELILKWKNWGVKNILATIKFQGETDWKMIEEFQKIPSSRLLHLCANKHELTFIHQSEE